MANVHKLLTDIKCLDLGILPEDIFVGAEPFANISADEKRVMCRKFRKLRRKLQKKTTRRVTRRDVMHEIQMQAWLELVE